MDNRESRLSTGGEQQQDEASQEARVCALSNGEDGAGCSCCGMSGRGGKLRIGLMIALAITIVALMVYGFAGA